MTHLKPASRRLHPLYAPAYRERDYSFFQGPRIRARKFKKTGSRLLVLGGRHAGKAIIRIVRPEAFEAWKKAFDAGLAVEPILKSPNGKPWFWKDKNGYVWVMAKVLGTTVDAYLNSAEAERHPEHRAELVRQVEELDRKLLDLGIHHNHAHFGNACIEWERRDGKRQPKAYLIDFDAAWVSKAMLRGGHGETTSS
ncbi:MAG TPA: hypothetical protein HA252_03285 [Candidatus Diapherotrites archaeon]|uniref:Serine/threonine protein kinase n=1 Tax=Candidatus Iainarchaeum sp. TaxID=3101447 RepID=A0A7J4JF64_9ARCH|nr:hypothetical protein [Candidatus Diapherotrites archaeon]